MGEGQPLTSSRTNDASKPVRSGQGASPLLLAGLALLIALALFAAYRLIGAVGSDHSLAGSDDYVLVRSTGQTATAEGTLPGAATTDPNMMTSGLLLAEGLDLAPAKLGPATQGYAITRDSDPDTLAQHDLRVGDVILDMDQQPLTPQRIEALGGELGLLDAVEISFMRDGQMRSEMLVFER